MVLWLGAKAVLAGEMTAGTMSQFVIYAVLVGVSGSALIEFFGELQRAAGAMERLGQLLLYLRTPIRRKPCCNSFGEKGSHSI